jgi:hypothetical protein
MTARPVSLALARNIARAVNNGNSGDSGESVIALFA